MSSPEHSAHLERDVLRLPTPDLSALRRYDDALQNHAIPVVERLVHLKDTGVTRQNSTIAIYSSGRGMYAQLWNNELKYAINDLGYATGIRIAVNSAYSGICIAPEWLITALRHVDLPPSLEFRITPQRIDKVLDLAEQALKKRTQTVRSDTEKGYIPVVTDVQELLEKRRNKKRWDTLRRTPDYRLKVSFTEDFYRPKGCELLHKIELMPT